MTGKQAIAKLKKLVSKSNDSSESKALAGFLIGSLDDGDGDDVVVTLIQGLEGAVTSVRDLLWPETPEREAKRKEVVRRQAASRETDADCTSVFEEFESLVRCERSGVAHWSDLELDDYLATHDENGQPTD